MSNKLVFTILLFATVLLIPASSFSNSLSPLIIEKFVSSVYAQKESSFNSNMAFQLPALKIGDSNALSQNLSQSELIESSELSESSESSTTVTESINSDSTTTTTSTTQSSSTQSNNNNNMITSSYFADKDNVQYSYHYPLKNEYVDDDDNIHKQIKKCNLCFISELKKLHDKQLADQILKEIKNEFGDIANLCKLILNEEIDRNQLENILYSILFGTEKDNNNKDIHYDISDKYYYYYDDDENNKNQYKSSNDYKMKEKKYYYDYDDESEMKDHVIYNEYYIPYDNKEKYIKEYPPEYYNDNDENSYNYYGYQNDNKYSDEDYQNNKFIDAKLKNNFIQNVLECLFQPPIIYVVWEDNTPGNFDIFFSFSNNNGLTFSQPDNISNNNGLSVNPQIATDKDNIYIVWQDDTPSNNDIFFSFSDNNGLTFSQPDNISNNAGVSAGPQIATDKDNIYIVWDDDTPGNFDIFFSFSNNNGLTFSQPDNISNNAGVSAGPQIATDKDNIYIVWDDDTPGNFDIFFSFSNNNGLTFSQPDNISNNNGLSVNPQIATDKDNIYIVWQDDTPGNNDIFFSFSDNNGLTFSQPDNISNNAGVSGFPQIATDKDNIYIVWQDDTPGNFDIFFSFSDNNGLTFSQPENISNNAGFSAGPQIATDKDNVYIVWQDDTPGNFDIFFSFSDNNGFSFSQPDNISNNAGVSVGHQIATDKDNVYIVWQDDTPGNFDIFFSFSDNNGFSFSQPDNISNNAGVSQNPQIIIN